MQVIWKASQIQHQWYPPNRTNSMSNWILKVDTTAKKKQPEKWAQHLFSCSQSLNSNQVPNHYKSIQIGLGLGNQAFIVQVKTACS